MLLLWQLPLSEGQRSPQGTLQSPGDGGLLPTGVMAPGREIGS